MTLPAGTRLGPYEILAPIGAGGMGEVYRAKDPRLGRDVAIKVLPASFSSDADRLRRFEQEAKAAGLLNHPNITIVYDFGSHKGAPYVVQELLEGETLRAELAGGRLPPRKAIDYALQIAHGLAAAHEKGIVHRDLKPENLFVTNDGRVKILDFGLAKLTLNEARPDATGLPTATGGTEPGVVLGTLGYMSPEQVKGLPADHRSDIFSFGAILYEMLSGRRAFRGDSAVETMSAILKEDPPDLSESNRNLSPGLERLVRHCLEKAPAQRFQSASDLAYDLESLAGVSGATAAAKPLAAPSRRWRKPAAAAALLAVGLLAGWGLHATRQKPKSPSYQRVTFRRGFIFDARFAPDGQTIVYSAAWEGQPQRLFATRAGGIESRSLQLPDGQLLAVSSTGELAIAIGREEVMRFAGTLARVPLEGGAPREVLENVSLADWSPDGRDLAIVRKVGGKTRLEFPIGKVIYETGLDIGDMRFSPRGDRLALIQNYNSIVLVDLAGKATTLLKGWADIRRVAWNPDGSEIWFSGTRSRKLAIHAISPSGRERLVRSEAGGLYLHDISKDGRVLLADYLFTQSLAVLTAGESKERDLTWMDRPFVDAISNDGQTVVFDEGGEGGGDNGAVYLRKADGSAAVRLGEGLGLGLSPDGRWVLSQPLAPAEARETFVLLPTGPGQARSLKHRGITSPGWGWFFPDGKRVLFIGRAGDRPLRLYVQDLDGEARAISPEGLPTGPVAVSSDGRLVAAQGPDSTILIFPVDGSAPRALAGALAAESPIHWSADGQTLYVYRRSEAPARVFKIDVGSGRRELWKEIAPADRTGLLGIDSIVMSPDARAYAYTSTRILSSLEVAEGLR